MRKKLFAIEDNNDTDPLEKNELLIDKVLDYENKTKSDVSITADLIKQRHDLRKEITKEFKESKDKDEQDEANNEDDNSGATDENTNDEGGGDASETTPSGDDTPADGDEGDDQDKSDGDKDSGDDQPAVKADGEDSDESAAADDADTLRKIVGSGSASTESFLNTKTVKAPVSKKRVASEGFGLVGELTALRGLFKPLKTSHQRRCLAIEEFGIQSAVKATEQPLVYVKDEVVQSLNNLIQVAHQYVTRNTTTVQATSTGLKGLGEKLTVYREFMQAQKFSFTQQLIQDKELLEQISVAGKSDPVITSGILERYLERSSALAVKILQSPFEQLTEAFSTAGFKDSGVAALMVAEEMLPGFVQMQVSLVPFSNYIDAKYEEYQVFKLRRHKPQDLYSLDAICIDDDSSYKKLLNTLDKILMSAGLMLDNLQVVSDHYHKFSDGMKSLVHDVNSGAQTDLAGLDLDSKLKDFIKFKLVTELYLGDLDAAVSYLSAALGVIARAVELSDK